MTNDNLVFGLSAIQYLYCADIDDAGPTVPLEFIEEYLDTISTVSRSCDEGINLATNLRVSYELDVSLEYIAQYHSLFKDRGPDLFKFYEFASEFVPTDYIAAMLRVIDDNRGKFPIYPAVLIIDLYRLDMSPSECETLLEYIEGEDFRSMSRQEIPVDYAISVFEEFKKHRTYCSISNVALMHDNDIAIEDCVEYLQELRSRD